MTDALLEIKDLEIVYQTDGETVHAVNRISLNVNTKETLGLVGETGAGKTTTALAVMRLLPDRIGKVGQGQILFEGENLLDLKESEMLGVRGEKIAMIFQDPMTSLNPVLTVEDQIQEVLQFHNHNGLCKAEMGKKVEEMLELVGIPAARKTCYPHEFSGGMKQRVVIAMALVCEPELVIADEPTTALDVTIQAQVLEMMENLKNKLNTSMILITHDLGVVAETCDDVAIMYAGEIIEYGTVEDIFDMEKSHHPYTEGLFNSIPRLNDTSERLKPIPGLMPDPTALPCGCSFHPRCPYCSSKCRQAEPGVYHSGTHKIRCTRMADDHTMTDDKEGGAC